MSTVSGMVQYHADLAPLLTDIDTVTQWPKNYNNGDVEEIAASIEINGMYRPIYVQRSTGYILAGNHTWEACKSLGATLIPVVYLDVDDTTAKRVAIGDNEIARLARPDNAALLELLEDLAATDSLLGTGMTQRDLLQLRALAQVEVAYDEHATWPTISVQVPPHVRAAYYDMTEHAVGDRERFEMMLRLAGWDGRRP
jgi:hypothetical protein